MKWLLIVLLSVNMAAYSAFANEEGGGHGEKKEEGKKGEEKGGSGAEFAKHDAAMGQFYAKIGTAERTIRELIEEKNKTKDDTKARGLIEEIKSNLKERKEAIEKYNKEYQIIRYQYPQRGRDMVGKYKKFDDKKIKEFEDEVNKELSNVYNNVKQKYGN